jgi:hypothetical protein
LKENKLTTLTPLYGPSFGSYRVDDVAWLLKDLSHLQLEATVEDREESIQSGGSHYAESLPIEYQPTADYQNLFEAALAESAQQMANAVAIVAEQILALKGQNVVLVSLARAGTPVGVLIKRWIEERYGIFAPHYAVSIVRGKGIDVNALGYIAEHHNAKDAIFIDGWTGKGAISKELAVALEVYEEKTGIHFGRELAVLADPGSCVEIFGTRADFLIPSACLNSTVSGLVSRTVLNDDFIGPEDFHGAKFYKELLDVDVSYDFIDAITAKFATVTVLSHTEDTTPTWDGWSTIERISNEYGINNVNLVKPGVGETTRVLLRRVPWRILIRRDAYDSLAHIRLLAESKGVEIQVVDELAYSCIGIIHPNFTKGATGFDGKVA